ncbi:MAG TPA: hypothetical protein VM238_22815 [Phycisphaerae bacterium]|nr:hypothetical protein [Phycisphaerae bacterium]
MGRPTKYRPEFLEQARFVCESKGFTDEDLAGLFRVSVSTLDLWKQRRPEFSEAIKAAKENFDRQVVERACIALASGYWYQEEIWDPRTERIIRLWKYHHADPKAIMIWQHNRSGWKLPAPPRPGAEASGHALPAGGDEAPVEGDFTQLAREFLENQYGTRIRVPSQTLEPEKEGDDAAAGSERTVR